MSTSLKTSIKCAHVFRQRAFEAQSFACCRVLESEDGGMQGLAAETGQSLPCLRRQARCGSLEARAIDLISHHRTPHVRHVHADLMGAPRLQAALHERGHGPGIVWRKALQQLVVGYGRPSGFAAHHGDFLPVVP